MDSQGPGEKININFKVLLERDCGSASSPKSKDFSMRLGPAMLRPPPLLGFYNPTKKVNREKL